MAVWTILLALFAIVNASGPAQAQVISGDDPHFGPGSIVIDQTTGLEWLSPLFSVNRSFQDVSAQFGPGGDYEGFRYATQSELTTFWQNAGLGIGFNFPSGPYETFLDLIGMTEPLAGGNRNRTVALVSTEASPGLFFAPDVGWFLPASSTSGFANPNNCCVTATLALPVLGSWLVRMPRVLTALGAAQAWIGLKNSDAVGLRLDVRVELFLNSTADPPIGTGQLDNVRSGSSGFNNAVLNTIPLALTGGPVSLAGGDQLLLTVSVRRTCSGGGHKSGTVRFWYDGNPIDSGPSRDAGSRFDATIDSTDAYYLRTGFVLATTPGTARTSIDVPVNSSVACPNRPFTPFGAWSIAP